MGARLASFSESSHGRHALRPLDALLPLPEGRCRAERSPLLMGEYSKPMIRLIESPTTIAAAGNKPKRIEEYVGRVNTSTEQISVARMQSAPGWEEPGQTPEFDEFTIVLAGMLRVETRTAGARGPGWSGRARVGRGMGALQHAGSRGRRIHFGVPAGVFAAYGAPRLVNKTARDSTRSHPVAARCRCMTGQVRWIHTDASRRLGCLRHPEVRRPPAHTGAAA